MSIRFDPETGTFTLTTCATTYQMEVDDLGQLLHLYYGRRTAGDPLSYRLIPMDCGFSPNAYQRGAERTRSMDTLPQEYSGSNTGDFRLSSVEVVTELGAFGAALRYQSHAITAGKYTVEGMPAAFDPTGESQTLTITMADEATGLEVELLYGVFPQQDVITRAVRLSNRGQGALRLEKAASLCLDLPFGDWSLLHFHGRHEMERQPERRPLLSGIQTISSRRGASSHQHNPFVVLCDPAATEETGDCIGAMLVYSGSFSAEIEVDQMGSTRLVMGIHSEGFSWYLAPGETFATPEVLLTFTHQGLTHLSHTYHRFLRRHIMRSPYAAAPRPVLLNNWEATYFHFDTESLLAIARQGAALGVELLVLDDGWFGHREDDRSSLGDWQVNETKLPGGLAPLIRQVEDMGLRFGLWVEPEMVSEDSDLYRAHPDWALRLPGRQPALSRSQLVLDFSRPEVVEHLYQCLSALLGQYPISYIKWDMNRNMTDVYSAALPPERQGEVTHRAMLGVYRLLERLTSAFPHVLFEGCAGGGGRFDAGMLAYFPQIWCSDNTDAIERLTIQYGTSFGYPVSAMGSHVSICPNHQTGRTTPLGTRGVVAMSGAFGYELDLNRLTAEEREEVRCQIAAYHRYQDLIHNGDYYRLLPPEGEVTAWQFAAPDGAEALVNVVMTHTRANARPIHFRLKGLDPEGLYELRRADYYGTTPEHPEVTPVGGRYSGSSLLYAGLTLPRIGGDYPSAQFHFVRISPEIRG